MTRLEKNQEKLAVLERDWRDLGTVRQVTFHARFLDREDEVPGCWPPPEERAASFMALAQTLGFGGNSYGDQYGDWTVHVSKRFVPTAEIITEIEEQFDAFCSSESGYLDGWFYPPSRKVEFGPDARSNGRAVQARSDVLFGVAPVSDSVNPSSSSFRLVPAEFLRRAKSMQPSGPEPTASAFSQWVYSLYADAHGNQEDRDQGKTAEAVIWDARVAERRRMTPGCVDNGFLRDVGSPWRLLHNGLHDVGGARPTHFELPQLRVQGEALRVSPDLVFLNRQESRAAIVEIKYSQMPIPKNLWPNIWAQLWCYSHIENLALMDEITVIGEVWGERWTRSSGGGRRGIVPGKRIICLRSSVRRDPRSPKFDQFFRRLFEIYRGH
ncbi:ribonuclease E inhibitor RraB [uncultured Caulobacter sp.]|uniref:ribonuclease E inhibitor RraB n=1 Tax=uncultured Caulobacter sp. TaxID=158749 RepID=UPI0026284395|nr:ribonuclease E inhibitor RraB [uncultured Caulobacter sp.]